MHKRDEDLDQVAEVTAKIQRGGLPARFNKWFASKGWQVRGHQTALLNQARAGRSTLLIAPTGAGKTLAGFLPSLVELSRQPAATTGRIHTLYISPLKALAVDVARNLAIPAEDMGLDIKIETRSGDTPAARRQRQRTKPPDILLTTPEQVALMLSHPESVRQFSGLKYVILDELHSLVTSKRGDLLALGLARIQAIVPDVVTIGLSATVAYPAQLRAYLVPQNDPDTRCELADLVVSHDDVPAQIQILESKQQMPWSGHSARYALGDIYREIGSHRTVLIFVNTRSQAEILFQELWHINDDNLAIALHHGSLDVQQRRKVEAAMADGRLRAVVCTSTLDLGIDWGDVDLVINVGAPKGASRIAQRIGRANHRLDEASRALLVPANNFEVLECHAALEAAKAGVQDTAPARTGALDVLAQHVLGMACSAPFDADVLFGEVRSAAVYGCLKREQFDKIIDLVATGGYALRTYERYARIRKTDDGLYRISNPRIAQQYRLNAGTIVEAPMLKVRLTRPGRQISGNRTSTPRGGRVLGEVEEWFIDQLVPGDTFVFAGQVLRFEGLRETDAYASRSNSADPKVPSYQGGKFPLSTYLAARVRRILSERQTWQELPEQVSQWLEVQQRKSVIPEADQMLVETFPRGHKHYLVCYPFDGRLAHQTLGMLLTRRLERTRARPLGFVANDYALAIWGLGDMGAMITQGRLSIEQLFDEDMLGDDLDAWLAESSLMKRTFRMCAIIAGLIERNHIGRKKTGRQMTASSDLIYDVLKAHDPGHILLTAAWNDAASGLLDIARLGKLLSRIKQRIRHIDLEQLSPLSVPVLLEIGREPIFGEAREDLLRLATQQLLGEVMAPDKTGPDKQVAE